MSIWFWLMLAGWVLAGGAAIIAAGFAMLNSHYEKCGYAWCPTCHRAGKVWR